jgi:rhodanese-related sulfurtransferase
MKKTVKSMVDEAMAAITTYSVEEARELHGREDVQFVDLRDVRELERDGVIPGAFHAPRGMLEFWVDPESPYHKPVFNKPGTRYVLFCAAGWRSALATRTMQEMGIADVGHIEGGFDAWKRSGAPVAERKRKDPAR